MTIKPARNFNHIAVPTADTQETCRFYTEVLGMKLVHRPDFGFPGAWIAAGDAVPIVHIYAGGPALVDGKTPYGTAAPIHGRPAVRSAKTEGGVAAPSSRHTPLLCPAPDLIGGGQ